MTAQMTMFQVQLWGFTAVIENNANRYKNRIWRVYSV